MLHSSISVFNRAMRSSWSRRAEASSQGGRGFEGMGVISLRIRSITPLSPSSLRVFKAAHLLMVRLIGCSL